MRAQAGDRLVEPEERGAARRRARATTVSSVDEQDPADEAETAALSGGCL